MRSTAWGCSGFRHAQLLVSILYIDMDVSNQRIMEYEIADHRSFFTSCQLLLS